MLDAQDEAPEAGAVQPQAGREEVVPAQHEAEALNQLIQAAAQRTHAAQLDGGGALALRHLLRRDLRRATRSATQVARTARHVQLPKHMIGALNQCRPKA